MFLKTLLVEKITFGFASAITLYPFVLVRTNTRLRSALIRHEKIHLKQQLEMLVLPFFLFYIAEYWIRRFYYKNHYLAYKNISFEREAYENEKDPLYLKNRKVYSWLKYLSSKKKKKGSRINRSLLFL